MTRQFQFNAHRKAIRSLQEACTADRSKDRKKVATEEVITSSTRLRQASTTEDHLPVGLYQVKKKTQALPVGFCQIKNRSLYQRKKRKLLQKVKHFLPRIPSF